MAFFFDYWPLIVAFFAIAGMAVIYVWRYAGLPTADQLDKVREWLLWAVTQAEMELGGGTGQLKLRAVYDMFVQRFPSMARLISFNTFSDLVDDALDNMREMLHRNDAIKAIVDGDVG